MNPPRTSIPPDSAFRQHGESSGSTDNPSDTNASHTVKLCPLCKRIPGSRNLVICLDGTSNKFGLKNTMIVQLYQYIRKYGTRYETTAHPPFAEDEEPAIRETPDCSHCGQYFEQLTYYNSGIGTYAADDTIKSPTKYLVTLFKSVRDMAFAWYSKLSVDSTDCLTSPRRHFQEIVQRAYHWLSDNHHPGDRIYLFGFSRGAYQVRALAGMINEVGLIFRGNTEQIPFAYEIYAKKSTINYCSTFRRAFSRRDDIRIHFMGIWDCISSVGIFKNIELPSTKFSPNVDYYRHTLALDERRVKFIPEFVDEWSQSERRAKLIEELDKAGVTQEKRAQRLCEEREKQHMEYRTGPCPRIKEVWFTGRHSDVGGGNEDNADLERPSISLDWMMREASAAGLKFIEPVSGRWEPLPNYLFNPPSPPKGILWSLLDYVIPVKWSDYNEQTWESRRVRFLHRFRDRKILSGQMTHVTVEIRHALGIGGKNRGQGPSEYSFRMTFPASYELEWLDGDRINLLVGRLVDKEKNDDDRKKVSEALRIVAVSNDGCEALSENQNYEKLATYLPHPTDDESTQLSDSDALAQVQCAIAATLSQVVYFVVSSSNADPNQKAWLDRADAIFPALHQLLCRTNQEVIHRRCLAVFSHLLYRPEIRNRCVDWYYGLPKAKRNALHQAGKAYPELYDSSIHILKVMCRIRDLPPNDRDATVPNDLGDLVENVIDALSPERRSLPLSQDESDLTVDQDGVELRTLERALWHLYKLSDTSEGKKRVNANEVDLVSVARLLLHDKFASWPPSAQMRLIDATALVVTILARLIMGSGPRPSPFHPQFDSVNEITSKFLTKFPTLPASGTENDRSLWVIYMESLRDTVTAARGRARSDTPGSVASDHVQA